jgi:hypothetical protein
MITIQNKSMDLQNESTFLQISYTIPASLVLLPTKLFVGVPILAPFISLLQSCQRRTDPRPLLCFYVYVTFL